jgi:hypothetical protein
LGTTYSGSIDFGGYEWEVKSGVGGPGGDNNHWSDALDNVSKNGDGSVTLRTSKVNGTWYSAELRTKIPLSFGGCQVTVDGPIDFLGNGTVLGLFFYGDEDFKNEIDIEFAHFDEMNPRNNGNYTVWPADPNAYPPNLNQDKKKDTKSFKFSLLKRESLHGILWQTKSVNFSSCLADGTVLGQYSFAPLDPMVKIPQIPIRFHINLWRRETEVVDKPAKIVIRSFSYTPIELLQKVPEGPCWYWEEPGHRATFCPNPQDRP